jgi:uncharacterized membrane protein
MCLVCTKVSTVIVFLCSIKLLVFTTEQKCVYCAVRTGFLNVIQANLYISRINLYQIMTASSL